MRNVHKTEAKALLRQRMNAVSWLPAVGRLPKAGRSDDTMADRHARDRMMKAIRSYMSEEITAFQFDEALSEATAGTNDRTVQAVGRALWFHYDDCKDHRIVASKEEWDYFNRLLLLLASDGQFETVRTWREWHPLQGVAALLLAGFLLIAVRVGIGEHLWAYALPFGPPSMVLAWLNSRRRRKAAGPFENVLAPFPSLGSLRAARLRVAGFVRRRYPKAIARRRIREPVVEMLMWLPWSITWCMFSPVVLFFQMLPGRDSETRIRMPETRAGADAEPPSTQP